MRRWWIGFAVLAVAAASLAGVRPSQPEPASASQARKSPEPLYGILGEWGRGARLARLDARSLRPLRGPTLEMLDAVDGWSFSPDGSRLALGTACQAGLSLGTLRLVDVRRMREVGCFGIGPVAAVAWPRRDRLLVVVHSPLRIFLIDPGAGRIVRQAPIEGAGPAEIARVGDRLVVLTNRSVAEPEKLVVADSRGSVRSVEITMPGASDLVVDSGARRGYVVSTSAVAEVDLDTLAVAGRELRDHVALHTRRLAAFRPTAQSKEVALTWRRALWLGGGVIALTGYDATTDGRSVSSRPVGLKLIDTRTWTVRTVNAQVSFAHVSGDRLLATGGREIGLAVYDFRGTKRYQVFGGRRVAVMETYGGRAYVNVGGNLTPKILDVRTGGSIATRQAPFNLLLVERPRWRSP